MFIRSTEISSWLSRRLLPDILNDSLHDPCQVCIQTTVSMDDRVHCRGVLLGSLIEYQRHRLCRSRAPVKLAPPKGPLQFTMLAIRLLANLAPLVMSGTNVPLWLASKFQDVTSTISHTTCRFYPLRTAPINVTRWCSIQFSSAG